MTGDPLPQTGWLRGVCPKGCEDVLYYCVRLKRTHAGSPRCPNCAALMRWHWGRFADPPVFIDESEIPIEHADVLTMPLHPVPMDDEETPT